MSTTPMTDELPEFLRSFDELTAHFEEHFGTLGSNARGDTFLGLAQRIVPLTEECSTYPQPTPAPKKSHDDGVDMLTAKDADDRILCVQSKYKIRTKDEIDTIISKFRHFQSTLKPERQLSLLQTTETGAVPVPIFAIITSSKLDGILRKYEESTLTSREHYQNLLEQKRLIFIDGVRILTLLQQHYRKTHLVPATVSVKSVVPWTRCGDVLLGVVKGSDLVDLYRVHGDSLFFENIREFLGAHSGKVVKSRETVNQDIIATITDTPDKMLARNNGIVFRAESIGDADGDIATLTKAAIVNGCQTTMCLVQAAPVANDCLVQAKVVQTSDAWDIAKAANNQNPVARVDLDLARYLRPQLVRRVATSLGYALQTDTPQTASSIMNAIYRHKIDYEELRFLCLGLFSRRPNNLFDLNYAELREDVLSAIYSSDAGEEKVFAVLLLVLKEGRVAIEQCRTSYDGPDYAPLFKRFFDDDKPRYRVYLAILAVCAATKDDISQRSPSTETEVGRVSRFLAEAQHKLENEPEDYHEIYQLAFEALAFELLDATTGKTDNEVSQSMYHKTTSTSFSMLYKKVRMHIDGTRNRARGKP